jgi:hypothetical protein
MTRNKYLLLLLILPFIGHADGQDGLVIILDFFTFIFVFGIWAALVFPTIKLLNKYRAVKLSATTKLITIAGTALIALFIFLMLKSDSYPFDGPIDSIIYKEQNELMRQNAIDNITNGYSDSTIEENIADIDTSRIGIYIWLNHKSVFVRKNTSNFGTQRQEDSLTMAIVRGWKK